MSLRIFSQLLNKEMLLELEADSMLLDGIRYTQDEIELMKACSGEMIQLIHRVKESFGGTVIPSAWEPS